MPYTFRISVEYTNNTNARQKTDEVDGSHLFRLRNAKDPAHAQVSVACSGPVSTDPAIAHILFKLNP
jgi:hypothetical protein